MIKIFNESELYPIYEIINGKKIKKRSNSPRHSFVVGALSSNLDNYLHGNGRGKVFINNLNVHLSDENIFKPDIIVVSKENSHIIDWNRGIYGVPDMVVEVLSRSTRKIDLTSKKDSYEACGVKEYWTVDPILRLVDVYLLNDGKYKFDEEYVYYNDEDFQELTDEEKAEVKTEIKLSIFEDCVVKLADIFSFEF